MHSKARTLALVLACSGAALGLFAAPAMATVTATTEPASEVKATSATLNATVDTENAQALVGFEVGLSEGSGEGTPGQIVRSGSPQAFSATVTELEPESTYYFRVVASREGTTVYGSSLTFTTPKLKGLSWDESGAFHALTYPAYIAGSFSGDDDPFELSFGESVGRCDAGELTAAMVEASSTLLLRPRFEECEGLEAFAYFSPNTCSFSLAEPPSGVIGISCSAGGDAMEFVIPDICRISLPEQSMGGHAVIGMSGTGEGSTLSVSAERSTLSFTKQGTFCFLLPGNPLLRLPATTLAQTE